MKSRQAGPTRSTHPLLTWLVVCLISYQAVRCMGQCASGEPTKMRIRRRHLDDLSSIASNIIGRAIAISENVTDLEILTLLDTMRELSPRSVEAFENIIQREYHNEMEAWTWMCRSQQTLGKRRKRESVLDNLA